MTDKYEQETFILSRPLPIPTEPARRLKCLSREEYDRLKSLESTYAAQLLLIRSHLTWLYGFLSSKADEDDRWAQNARDGVERALEDSGGFPSFLRKKPDWPHRGPGDAG